MQKSKKIVLALAGVIALVGIGSLGVKAYFTSQDKESTTFKIVKIDTDIEEKIDTTNKKEITVKSVGTSDCYVRVRVTTSPQELIEAVSLDDFNSTDWYEEKVDENQDGKVDYSYYYYRKVLAAGTSTTPLHSGYSIDKEILNSLNLDNIQLDITAYEESVQVLYEIEPSDPMKAILDSFEEYDKYNRK